MCHSVESRQAANKAFKNGANKNKSFCVSPKHRVRLHNQDKDTFPGDGAVSDESIFSDKI